VTGLHFERSRDGASRQNERLLEIAHAIAAGVSRTEVYTAIVEHAAHVIDTSSAALWIADEDGHAARLVHSFGYSEDARERLATLSLDRALDGALDHERRTPAADCMRSREPIWISSRAALLARYPDLEGVAAPARASHLASLPLLAHGRLLGALAFTTEHEEAASDDERRFLLLVASHASQALERLRLLEAERRTRAEADAASRRLEMLSRASRAFVDSDLELDSRLESIASELATAFDSCIAIAFLENDGLLYVRASGHPGPAAQASLRSASRHPIRMGEGFAGSIAATEKPVLIEEIEPEVLASRASPGFREFLACFPAYALIGAPLKMRGKLVGTVIATRVRKGERYTAEDLRLLEELAELAAIAIDNARLFRESSSGRARAEQLYLFAHAVVGAERIDVVFEAAMDAVEAAIGAKRSAILTLDDERGMRFRAWRGLSERYRRAVEGHSPWTRDATRFEPVVIADAAREPSMATYHSLFRAEGIGALAFVPLVASGKLIGKFMLYYDSPRVLEPYELEASKAIANHLASMIARFTAIGRLEDIVRYNELFAGVLAHDLRNPLGAMMMAAQFVVEQSDDDRVLKPLARVVRSGQRMSRMIDQLLDFTRTRLGGGIPLARREANVELLVRHTLEELELTSSGWSFRIESSGDLLGSWDPDRISQVLSNLAGNAVQHGSPDDPLVVRLDGTADKKVVIEVRNKGTVRPDVLATLFEPFRVTQQKRDGSRGLGLGLFISREIVRAHGGEIVVRSSEGAGTVFRVELPRHAPAVIEGLSTGTTPSAPPVRRDTGRFPSTFSDLPSRPPEPGPGEPGPVLIVDDDRDIREAVAETLEDKGFAVLSANNGLEALKLLRSGEPRPSVILLDLMMPVMDGYRFLAEQRADPAIAGIPTVIFTAGHGVERSRLGDVPVLAKPIDVPLLVSTLRRLREASPKP
jgi:signal transduction histidine kinase/CheY-like chemotaxis protein